ncbi:unnamed protein product [Nesidiocoris tenuis]|uniref:Cytohesin Ubiquitin Protein Inducing domain-containing protein n=1 Tax=Nesidiocoris tenuis TaxID=355587 RepID=A0A6H5G729_9HEMI|nr:unnamed protein product [Nesidiocoris tenuis]
MVASLQSKKEALEAKIRDKTSELRKLCIEEAELTGVLPVETPLEPGESPPQFRRRVGTAFTYPENLINKLRSKEDETLAALELECKIQIGIAEAAKGLANDGTATKSVRRKHRILYDESQRRLLELEARLAAYRKARENQPKQKKKPRPLTEYGYKYLNVSCRFGSLERSSQYSESSDSENRTAATLPRNTTIPHSTTASVLLPNQTYPESSLMRTQSLGNMENLKHHAERAPTAAASTPPASASAVSRFDAVVPLQEYTKTSFLNSCLSIPSIFQRISQGLPTSIHGPYPKMPRRYLGNILMSHEREIGMSLIKGMLYRRRSGEISYLHFVKTATIPMVPYVTTLNFHDISNVHVQARNWRYEISPLRRRYLTEQFRGRYQLILKQRFNSSCETSMHPYQSVFFLCRALCIK